MAIQIPEKKKTKVAAPEAAAEQAVVTEEKVEEAAVAEGTADKTIYGSKRMTLAFKRPLGNPADKDTTTFKKADGQEETLIKPRIVGAVFECLEDMKVPNFGTTEKFREDPMDYEDLNRWVDAKKGEEVYLTPAEFAVLLSQPEFNGGCDGGEIPCFCVYAEKALKAKSGLTSVASLPRVALRIHNGSIKQLEYENVLDFEQVKTEGNATRNIKHLKEGDKYAKWAPLAVNATGKSARAGRAGKVQDTNKVNERAERFLRFVNARRAQ